MAEWAELPQFLLEPPEQQMTEQCTNCNKLLLEGDRVYSYYSHGQGSLPFCDSECAVDYFLNTELEEGIVE